MSKEILVLVAIIIISSSTSAYAFEPITIYDETSRYDLIVENMKFTCPDGTSHDNSDLSLSWQTAGTSIVGSITFNDKNVKFLGSPGVTDGTSFKFSAQTNRDFADPCEDKIHLLSITAMGKCNLDGFFTEDDFIFNMSRGHTLTSIPNNSTINTSCDTPLELIQPEGTVFPTCESPQILDRKSLSCITPASSLNMEATTLDGNELTFVSTIGETKTVAITLPQDGIDGINGRDGSQGVKGDKGDIGPTGDRGCSGTLKLVDNNCVPRIIEITGYDTRDRERLTYYQLANVISGGVAGNGVNFDERGVFTINNEKVFPEEINQVSLGNQDYFYVPRNSISPWNDDTGLVPGTYTIIESFNRGTGNHFAAMLAPEKKQAIVIDYEVDMVIGNVVDLEIYLKSGEVLTKAITIGSFVPAVG